MARTEVAVQVLDSKGGEAITFTAIDAANGMKFQNTGREVAIIQTAAAASVNVEFAQAACSHNRAERAWAAAPGSPAVITGDDDGFSVTGDQSASFPIGSLVRFKTTASGGQWVYGIVDDYAAGHDQVRLTRSTDPVADTEIGQLLAGLTSVQVSGSEVTASKERAFGPFPNPEDWGDGVSLGYIDFTSASGTVKVAVVRV